MKFTSVIWGRILLLCPSALSSITSFFLIQELLQNLKKSPDARVDLQMMEPVFLSSVPWLLWEILVPSSAFTPQLASPASLLSAREAGGGVLLMLYPSVTQDTILPTWDLFCPHSHTACRSVAYEERSSGNVWRISVMLPSFYSEVVDGSTRQPVSLRLLIRALIQ